jgi:hypothetical protein
VAQFYKLPIYDAGLRDSRQGFMALTEKEVRNVNALDKNPRGKRGVDEPQYSCTPPYDSKSLKQSCANPA